MKFDCGHFEKTKKDQAIFCLPKALLGSVHVSHQNKFIKPTTKVNINSMAMVCKSATFNSSHA